MQGFPTLGMPQPAGSTGDRSWAATSPSLGRPPADAGPGTYATAGVPAQPWPPANPGGAPPVLAMPGPAALGPGPVQGSMGTGGVAGVGIHPVTTVVPPAATGGPHPLPTLPACPLPQGFPNPFDLQNLGRGAGVEGVGQGPGRPGTTTVTGPQGYLPGLGYFGSNGPQSGLPGPQSGLPGPQSGLPGPQSAPARPPAQRAQAAPQASPPSPFWPALAWQLVNTPAVRSALGGRLATLMEGDARLRTIQVATALLLSPDLQNAFRAVSSGSLQQAPFTALFADRLRAALEAAGLGAAG